MLKLVIADDERVIRETISTIIDWKQYDIELVGLCKNGLEAYDAILDESPDIVLTDIRMPGMDAMELLEKCSELDFPPHFILLSGYGEFEYAQNAISLGVQEYLLKPVKLDAFKALFEKIIEICQEKEIEKKNRNDIIQVKEEAAQQKLSWNLLNYLESEELEEGTLNHWETLENEFISVVQKKICIPVIISCYSNLFSIEW